MPHPLPPHPRAARRRAATLALATHASLSAATASAGATLAVAALLLTPRAAHADDGLYEMCLEAVHAFAERCLKSADSILGDLGCMWLGGLGYLSCAVLEALRHLLPSGLPVA